MEHKPGAYPCFSIRCPPVFSLLHGIIKSDKLWPGYILIQLEGLFQNIFHKKHFSEAFLSIILTKPRYDILSCTVNSSGF